MSQSGSSEKTVKSILKNMENSLGGILLEKTHEAIPGCYYRHHTFLRTG
jgi:hypothetical protein